MEELNKAINLINEIDDCLDAYDFKGYTFEEYSKMTKEGKKGNKGLRNLIKYNSGGLYVWSTWMEKCIEDCKKTINNIYLNKKKGENIIIDKLDLERLIKRIRETRESFKKNTDNYSLYPIQSETIGKNLIDIAKYFEKFI